MRLDFAIDVDDVDPEGRTISGLGVPWGEPGLIAGKRYRFAEGSLTAAGKRTPLLLGHDGEPVGVLAAHVDDDAGARVTFKVDATPDGDRALVQAASGSRGALSVGADVDKSRLQADGSVLVTAARYAHFALVPEGAFPSAEVEHVVASRDQPNGGEPMDETPEPTPEPEPAPEPEPDGGDEPAAMRRRVPAIRASKTPELTAGGYAVHLLAAQKGDPESTRILAALTESPIANLGGLLPPQYERTVLHGKSVRRVLFSVFAGKPLPSVGTSIVKPVWTTPPDGAWAAALDADATTGAVNIGTQTAHVERWDWAGAMPYVAVQRADPDLIDTIYSALITDFYKDVETKIAAILDALVPNAADTLGTGLAAFEAANQISADVIVTAPDVWGALADAGVLAVSVGSAGVSATDGLTTSFAGVPITSAPALAAGKAVIATRRALDVRISDPVRLTANAIGALNVEFGVVGEGLFDTDYPSELMSLTTPIVLPELAVRSTPRSRS